MSLWDWALTTYAAEGVADACLELQETAGQNIPLLLWAAWCAHTGRTPDEDALEAAGDTASAAGMDGIPVPSGICGAASAQSMHGMPTRLGIPLCTSTEGRPPNTIPWTSSSPI